ncbi:MAG TPA: restriction endonuclease [Burkholderiaceae bacterium]|jgi:restriction system protein|nr:restriction endonuclease [Burkholderiaceae bacterium]
MKFQMAKNSLFAILLRKPWWVSLLIAVALGLVAAALLPADYRVAGAISGFPFLVIAGLAAWRQRLLPSATQVEATRQAVSAMAWPAFAALLEQAFRRDGYTVSRPARSSDAVDFVLERGNRRMFVAARRWKSARTGLEALRALQVAREAADGERINDALVVALGELTDSARPFAAEQRIAVWQAAEIAQALRGIPLDAR